MIKMPLTLFSTQRDDETAFRFFLNNNAKFSGTAEDWSASYEFMESGEISTITFTYEKSWCQQPNWGRELLGLQLRLLSFNVPRGRLEKLMPLLHQLGTCYGILNHPEVEGVDDQRLDLMNAFADHLDGIFVTADAILDRELRVMASAEGRYDSDVVFPSISKDD